MIPSAVSVEFAELALPPGLLEHKKLFQNQLVDAVKKDDVGQLQSFIQEIGCNDIVIDSVDDMGNRLLHHAAYHNAPNVINFLLNDVMLHQRKLGKNTAGFISQVNNYGWTPLHVAAANNNLEAVQVLIENRAQQEVKDSEGRRAVDLASDYNVRQVLVERPVVGTGYWTGAAAYPYPYPYPSR